jgi:hypothetical protein
MPNPSGRIKVIQFSAMQQPARCACCGRSGRNNEELFADPAIFFEFEGSIYFCQDCVSEMGALFGLAVAYNLRISLANKDAELLQTREALERSERINDDLTRERLARRDSVPIIASIPYGDTVTQIFDTGSQSVIAEPQSSDDSQSGVEEPVNVERPDDVSESSTDNVIEHAAAILASSGL